MIILSQNTLQSVRRAHLVRLKSDYQLGFPILWEDAGYVLESFKWLSDSIAEYAQTGFSWQRVSSAKADLARVVVQFEDSEDEARKFESANHVKQGASRTFTMTYRIAF